MHQWGPRVSTADRDIPALAPVMVTDVLVDTCCVRTPNVALLCPTETVTLDGTVARELLLLVRDTTVPADEAGPLRVTVPVEESPLRTLLGLRARADRDTPDP